MEDIAKIAQEIQYIIVPAVTISSSALFLLGFQTKFSNLATRFRALNHEKRQFLTQATRSEVDQLRLASLTEQVDHLMKRAYCVKSAILFTYGGILCFVGTSILLFLKALFMFPPRQVVVAVFLVGFLCLAVVAIFMIAETIIFYKVISLEKDTLEGALKK